MKLLEYKHLENMQVLKITEAQNEREHATNEKNNELGHIRFMRGENKINEIILDTFSKIKDLDSNHYYLDKYDFLCLDWRYIRPKA